MKKRKFNPHEEKIIKTMHQFARPMTITEIAKKAHLGWGTTKKYIEQFEKEGIVIEEQIIEEKIYYTLNY